MGRRFGSTRQGRSGRWEARYHGPDGKRHTAGKSFTRQRDAEAWLEDERWAIEHNKWEPPEPKNATPTFGEYAETVLARLEIKESTRELYRREVRLRLLPTFGSRRLDTITPQDVKRWFEMIGPTYPRARADAYARLSQILKSAVDDALIPTNPCKIKGGRKSKTKHKPVILTGDEVAKVAALMPAHLRLAVLLAPYCQARSGEVRELRRSDFDLEAGIMRIDRGVARVGGVYVSWSPKTDRSERVQTLPPGLIPIVRMHLDQFAEPGRDGLLFPRPGHPGEHFCEGSFNTLWRRAVAAAGFTGMKFHDLRHTGLTWLALADATVKELMQAAGHATPTQAMHYQHVAAGRMAELAAKLPPIVLPDQALGA